MKIQKIRNFLLLVSFLIFPITQFYFSPYLIIMGATEGIITGSFIVFSLFLFGGLFFGRGLCGWVMPCGSLQEMCTKVNNKKVKGGKLNLIKYFIWTPWILIVIGVFVKYGGFKTIDPFYQTTYGISVSSYKLYIIYYGVIILFVSIALIFGRRANCHYVCWMSPFMVIGRKVRNLLKLPALQLISKKDSCIDCKKCDNECAMSLEVSKMVQNNEMENSECILCGKCVEVCNKQAIKFSIGRPIK